MYSYDYYHFCYSFHFSCGPKVVEVGYVLIRRVTKSVYTTATSLISLVFNGLFSGANWVSRY